MIKKLLLLTLISTVSYSQAWKNFNILSGNPNATGNEIRFLNGTTGCLGATIATTNGVPAGNNNLPYGAAFDPASGKLYYGKAGTTAGTTVINVYNNTGATATNSNLATVSGGEFFRMCVGQDGMVYGTNTALVIQLSASAPRIDILTVKLTRYNPSTNAFTVLGNIQCPAAYSSTMPAPYNDGNYWSASDATTTPFYAAQLGSATYGDIVVAPDNTMYMTIGKKLIRIPNYQSLTGTALIPSVEIGSVLPTGVGYNFTTQGPGTYGMSWDYSASNLMLVSSRTSDGSDGSYNVNPATAALVGSFRVNCLATPTSANFGDLSSIISSIGVANSITNVQWLGYNNKYRITYRVRVENIGTSVLKNVQSVLNLSTAFPSLTISNVSTSFASNPAGLVLNATYNGTTTTNLLDGTKMLYGSIYNSANLNGGAGNVSAGSNFAVIDVTFDVAGVATNGTTTYNASATATGTAFDATTVTDTSDNGTAVETGVSNLKADDAGEGDPTPIKFGSSVSGTIWNDLDYSANSTFTNIFTTGESGTNAGGIQAILIDPITNLVIASSTVAANGTYSFANIPSFANLKVILTNATGVIGSAPPVLTLPSGWIYTSPSATNATGDINTGVYNTTDASRFGAIDDANNDFGIKLASTTPATHLNLDGVNDYVDLSNSATLQLNQGTVEAWVKVPSAIQSGYRGLVVKQYAYGLFVRDGFLVAYDWRGGQGEMNTGVNIADNNWHHIAMTFVNNGTLQIYIDGSLLLTDTDFAIVDQLNKLVLGAGNQVGTIQQFKGDIDEVRIWNAVQSQTDIQDLRNCELQAGQTGLAAYYKLNQGIDVDSNALVTSATDSSVNSNNGTLANLALIGVSSNWKAGSPVTTGNTCARLSSEEFDLASNWKVYPNPVSQFVVVELDNASNAQLEVYDVNGRLLMKNVLQFNQNKIDINHLVSGMYMFKITSDKGSKSIKVFKQ